jgi:hypothetical protein
MDFCYPKTTVPVYLSRMEVPDYLRFQQLPPTTPVKLHSVPVASLIGALVPGELKPLSAPVSATGISSAMLNDINAPTLVTINPMELAFNIAHNVSSPIQRPTPPLPPPPPSSSAASVVSTSVNHLSPASIGASPITTTTATKSAGSANVGVSTRKRSSRSRRGEASPFGSTLYDTPHSSTPSSPSSFSLLTNAAHVLMPFNSTEDLSTFNLGSGTPSLLGSLQHTPSSSTLMFGTNDSNAVMEVLSAMDALSNASARPQGAAASVASTVGATGAATTGAQPPTFAVPSHGVFAKSRKRRRSMTQDELRKQQQPLSNVPPLPSPPLSSSLTSGGSYGAFMRPPSSMPNTNFSLLDSTWGALGMPQLLTSTLPPPIPSATLAAVFQQPGGARRRSKEARTLRKMVEAAAEAGGHHSLSLPPQLQPTLPLMPTGTTLGDPSSSGGGYGMDSLLFGDQSQMLLPLVQSTLPAPMPVGSIPTTTNNPSAPLAVNPHDRRKSTERTKRKMSLSNFVTRDEPDKK